MSNSSETFKAGETVLTGGNYECLMCRQDGKESIRAFEKGKIVGYCEGCGIKDGTWRLKPAKAKSISR